MIRFCQFLMIASVVLGVAEFTSSQNKGTYYRIVSVRSGKVLDVQDGSLKAGAKIIQSNYSQAESQFWAMEPVGKNFKLMNRKSGKVLDIPKKAEEATQLIQANDTGAPTQAWMVEKKGKYFVIKSPVTMMVLDVEEGSKKAGAPVIQFRFEKGASEQLWEITEVK